MSRAADIGGMDRLVLVQSCEVRTNAQGAKGYVFTDHSRVFANIVEDSDESVIRGNLAEGRALSVTVYKIPGLSTRWRLVIDGQPYSVESVSDVSRTSPLCTLSVTSINEAL